MDENTVNRKWSLTETDNMIRRTITLLKIVYMLHQKERWAYRSSMQIAGIGTRGTGTCGTGTAVLGHAEVGQRFWDMRNWDSGSGTVFIV